jgi:hypothetical protein
VHAEPGLTVRAFPASATAIHLIELHPPFDNSESPQEPHRREPSRHFIAQTSAGGGVSNEYRWNRIRQQQRQCPSAIGDSVNGCGEKKDAAGSEIDCGAHRNTTADDNEIRFNIRNCELLSPVKDNTSAEVRPTAASPAHHRIDLLLDGSRRVRSPFTKRQNTANTRPEKTPQRHPVETGSRNGGSENTPVQGYNEKHRETIDGLQRKRNAHSSIRLAFANPLR